MIFPFKHHFWRMFQWQFPQKIADFPIDFPMTPPMYNVFFYIFPWLPKGKWDDPPSPPSSARRIQALALPPKAPRTQRGTHSHHIHLLAAAQGLAPVDGSANPEIWWIKSG
jgi:hypothetical protein